MKKAEDLRAQIHVLAESDDTHEKIRLLRDADDALTDVRLVGDLIIGAFFAESKDRAREQRRKAYAGKVQAWLSEPGNRSELQTIADELQEADKPVPAFHWGIEFPEVFLRPVQGFDAFVGNPPFLGGKRISTVHGDAYRDWLSSTHEDASNNADLIAFFYRRAFALVRNDGAFGLIATNTIAQGDTRRTGLGWIRKHGGVIYDARKRVKWPGHAAVIVSVVHVSKGAMAGGARLDGKAVEQITAFLVHKGGDDDPEPLRASLGRSFLGSDIGGQGFLFADDDSQATSIAEMRRLIGRDPRNAERILPYLGGEVLNSSPSHSAARYVIYFEEMSETEARSWPDLMAIVETRVKPERLKKSKEVAAYPWWRFWRPRRELYDALRSLERTLVIARVSATCAFTFVATRQVLNEKIVVLPFDKYAAFAVCQSRAHEAWARFFSTTLKDDLQYTPTECFETFPFPPSWTTDERLETTGRRYFEFRAGVMMKNEQGLTATYNRFHDPEENDPKILELRKYHAEMDRGVLDAYGWGNIQPACEFLLDYGEEERNEGKSKAKKPWRYRWPDEIRDEVLARLLALNRERAEQERLTGAAVPVEGKSGRCKSGRRGRRRDDGHTLFD